MNQNSTASAAIASAVSTDAAVYLENISLNWRHIWIVTVASLGQLSGTAIATLVSVILPLVQIFRHPELPSWQQGMIGASDLMGIAIGSVILGKLSDKWGYLKLFRLCPAIMLVAALVSVYVTNLWVLFSCLFIIGFAIGGEYSLDSDYVSELMPAKWRATMVGLTKAASAFGNILVAGIAYIIIYKWTSAAYWPRLMWMMVTLAGIMIASRLYFAPSPKWMLAHGHIDEARKAVRFFFGDKVTIDPAVIARAKSKVGQPHSSSTPEESLGDFIKRNFRKVILTGIPWACEGLGVYGIGVFLPILVLALGITHDQPDASPIMHVASSVEITFWISCIILPGFVLGLWLIRKMRNYTQLAWGFFLSAATLVVLMLGYHYHWANWISIVAFMGFELFLNIGPHLITYVLPPEVYPVKDRSLGSGIAASLGKIGAVLAVFFIPMLLKWGGIETVLIVSVAVMLLGGIVTAWLGPEVYRHRDPDEV